MMQGIPNVLPGNRLQFVNETDSILSGGDGLVGREFLQTGPDSKFENFKLKRDSDETDDFLLPGHIPCKKTKGRVKIKMEYIDNKLRRYTTFSKRKTGIMKKAYELSKLTGTQVMLLVASETGHVYTFATQKLQPMITSEGGKTLIQTCLNSPDGFSPDDCVISDQDIAGIDTIRSCDIDLTVTNDLLTAEDIIEQADSLVPCDSTSFENCIPKDLINKILDNAEDSSKSTFQQSPSIFPTYRQTSNSLTTGIHLQTTTTTNLVLQQQQQQTVTLQQHPPTAVPSHAHNNNNDCDDDRLVANEEDAFAGSSHRLVSLYKPPASQRRNADLTPRCGQLTAPVASAAAHHMTSDLLYASLTSSSDHSSPLDLDDSPLGGVADPLDGTTVGPGDDSSPLGTLDADGLHSRMMLGDSANGLKGSVQLFTPLAQHQTHQQLHLQHDQHGSPMIGNRRSLGKTPIRRSYKANLHDNEL